MNETKYFYNCNKINLLCTLFVTNSNMEFNNYLQFPQSKSFRALTNQYKYVERIRANNRRQSNTNFLIKDNCKNNFDYQTISISSIELKQSRVKRNLKIKLI